MANVEKAMKKPRTPHTPPRSSSSSVAVSHVGGPGSEPVEVKHEEEGESLLEDHQAPDAFTREASSDMSDISVEDGARLLLDFIASVRAAQGTPSP